MSQAILITGPTPQDRLVWAVAEADTLSRSGEVDALARVPKTVRNADQLTVILRGDRAATRRIPLPVRGEKALNEAAQLAFEDVLSDGVEDFHFAFGDPDESGARLVSAIPAGYLADWLDAIEDEGMDPELMTVDHLALWTEEYDTLVLEWDDYAVARLPNGGLSGDKNIIRMLMEKMDKGASILPMSLGETSLKPAIDGVDGLALADERALAAFYLSGFPTRLPPTFRRGRFARRRDWVGLVRPWRLSAGLMAACFGVW
ncbi:MAG: type II secretion system protein GspL, partial [Pseudomonadota bacterium]